MRTTRSSIVKSARTTSARRPSSAIPRLAEMKISIDDENPDSAIDRTSVTSNAQTMNVYVRLKPRFTKSKKLKKIQDDTYVITSPSTLLTKFTSLEGTTNPKKLKSPESTSRKFSFSRIFDFETTQSELFDQAIKQKIIEFLAGQSSSLMSYGTTNSGKSYTFYGNSESPGIIPRSIELIFSTVNCTLSPWYKPVNLVEVCSLDEAGRCQEIEVREHFLVGRSIDRTICYEAYKSLETSMKEEKEIGNSDEVMYSVWVSFAEIYNENVYDLLSEDDNSAKLNSLQLVKDKQGRAFVKGLRMICATTGLEAYQILIAGQSKLTVGSTKLNYESSRSHSIFTIKLLKYIKERIPEEVEVSTITFYDLAGTGRSKNTTGSGNELKEAKNINTSLLVLGRCLKVVSDCQGSRQSDEFTGPFRESKLTRLLQQALSGKENLTLIVNVNPSPDASVDTQSVLSFAAIAKKILVGSGRDVKQTYVPELMMPSPNETETTETQREKSCSARPTENSAKQELSFRAEMNKLQKCNAALLEEIENMKGMALNRELEIRQEMSNLCSGMMKDLESKWRKRSKDIEEEQEELMTWSVNRVEAFYKERIESFTNRKRRRTSGGDQLDDGKILFEELEAENAQLTAQITALKNMVKELKEEKDSLGADKNKCVFELSLARDELRQVREVINAERGEILVMNDNSKVIDELKNLINEKNGMIKSFKKQLDAKHIGLSDTKTKSNLSSFVTEELQEELRYITASVSEFELPIRIESAHEMNSEKLDAKILKSTLKKGSNVRFSSVARERPIIKVQHLIQSDEEKKNNHSNSLVTIGKVLRFSDDSGLDDSGIMSNGVSSSTENSVKQETEDKESQTSISNCDNRSTDTIHERVEQLKYDYTKLKSEHLQETMRVTELSHELECIQYALGELKATTNQNEQKIGEYREKLTSREKDFTNLDQTKSELEIKLNDVIKQLETKTFAYENKIVELRAKLKIREEKENEIAKTLAEYQKRSYTLECQLSEAQARLDKTSIKCATEHMLQIEMMNKELSLKNLRIEELNTKVSKFESHVVRVSELSERVTDISATFEEYQNEKADLRKQLLERLEAQSSLKSELKRLTIRVQERENEIASLRADSGNLFRMNMENSEVARELSKETAKSLGRLESVKQELVRSEDERRKLERTSGHEIGNLIARLADFERNSPLLARMRDNEDTRTDELDKMKILLHEKEREMCQYKKKSDKTIRRYFL